jgi:hypothetical protein
MEVAILAGLAGLGYAVTRATDKKPNKLMPVQQGQRVKEGFNNAPISNTGGVKPPAGASVKEQFATSNGMVYASEPNPGVQGSAFKYATMKAPELAPLTADMPKVAMRADNAQEQPNYMTAEATSKGVYSSLLGSYIATDDFTHNNQVPFYGGSVKQNHTPNLHQSRLDVYSGAGSFQIEKREVETMFDTGKTPYGSPYGLELESEYVQDRIVAPRNRAGERPFEPTRVAPGIGQGGGALGVGGFQQGSVNDVMRPRGVDDLRTADNPKMTYKGVVVPGKHFVGKSAEDVGEVRKYRPDRFYIDESGERWTAMPAGEVKEMVRSAQVIQDTNRQETAQEYVGIGGSQGFGESYVAGSYRAPMTQQFGGAGYRNANMNNYYTPYVDSPEADYGRSSFENRPNERLATQDRGMALNMAPAETGASSIHYDDSARPTRRGETVGTARPVGGAGSQNPSMTVWDPMDVARTTVKEGLIDLDRFGIASPADAPARLTVYDPEDVARKTQKEELSKKGYTGIATGQDNQAFSSQTAQRNMRQSSEKEHTLNKRKPVAGNGGMALFNSEINQTTKKLNADIVNDRALGVNRVSGITPGKADIGVAKLRVPLKLNQSSERFGPEMVSALDSNPYASQFRFSSAR